MPDTVRLFKTNDVNDPGYEVTVTEITKQFWASEPAAAWQEHGGNLERFALNWVSENLGQWERLHEDWTLIYHAIHMAMPRPTHGG